jgi:hypothetical protein
MNNILQFSNKSNLNILWDVLLDELHINTSNKNLINNIKTVFESNITPFKLRINPKANIMELNKQFLAQVLLAVNKLFPNLNRLQKQDPNIKRITISDEELSDSHSLEPYKIEDIHASRQSEFEKEVERKRLEMENYMIPQKPREFDFSDRNSDGKIKGMDSLVAEKMAQRNLEIEQIQNVNYNSSNLDPDQWLTSKETSIKIEKSNIEKKSIIKNNESSRLKHISIDNNNNIKLNISESINNSKKVSWDDLEENKDSTINIFNKLKKQPIIENIPNNKDDIKINIDETEKQYVLQESMSLPEIKQEEIIRGTNSLMKINNNEPILPKTEIIKQLNEMNTKIENLYELVYKLTNLLEKNNINLDEPNEITNNC